MQIAADSVPPVGGAAKSKAAGGRMKSVRIARQRVLMLLHSHLVPPENAATLPPEQTQPYQAEYDVLSTLRSLGHEVAVLPVGNDLRTIESAVLEHKPQVAFNLIESFANFRSFDQHIVAFLECLGVRYTGCNPRGMMLARDKALTKKILTYHRIRVPKFQVFPLGRKVLPPGEASYPLLVKSATDDGSVGISKASVVHDAAALRERVAFIHDVSHTDAIAEQYIEGRELYVGVYGNRTAAVLPVWELDLSRLPEGSPKIVTERMKTSLAYQRKYNIDSRAAELPPEQQRHIARVARRAYHALALSGYARLDLRMTPAGEVYVIEANPNPQIAAGEDFARSAADAKLPYPALLGKLLTLGMSYRPHGLA
jgi:D-alanine-D-alanine ligase